MEKEMTKENIQTQKADFSLNKHIMYTKAQL